MTVGRWSAVRRLVDEAAAGESGPGGARVAPAVSLLVGRGRDVLFEHAAGVAGLPGGETAVRDDTVFDVASLTKPLVTTALVLDLAARGRLGLDTPVAELLPGFADGQDERRRCVSVRDLLRHDAGLPAYQRYFEKFRADVPASTVEAGLQRRRMTALACGEPLEREPGSGSVYSDIGFLVLGAVVEAVGGARVDAMAAERIFGPLVLDGAGYVDVVRGMSPALARRTARTGACEWRRREIHAVVQDENAFAMGGLAPHAGLFATARAVHRLVAEWVEAREGRGRVLEQELVTHAWNREEAAGGAASRQESTWALGWDTPSPGASSAGTLAGASAVGHLGYTGTSVWVDPARAAHVVLLTNRIACGRNRDAIRDLRPRLHDAVFDAVGRD